MRSSSRFRDGKPTGSPRSSLSLGEDGAVCALVGSGDEITHHKRLEAELERGREEQTGFARRLRQLHRLATTPYRSFDALLADYLATGAEVLRLPNGIVCRIQDDTYTIRAAVSPGDAIEPGASFPLGDTPCAEVVGEKRTICSHDIPSDPARFDHPAFTRFEIQAYISTPITVGGHVYGTLNFSGTAPRKELFTEQDVELIELMADGVGHFLELERAERLLVEEKQRAEAARDAAEDANRAKSTFLNTMSHEIRTPLTGVLGFADILSSDPTLTEQQRSFAATIAGSGRRLITLINDVLDLASVESRAVQLHDEPLDTETLVSEALQVHAATAYGRGLELGYEIGSDVPHRIVADGRRLGQVLGNLISNAVKFTPSGEITVRLDLAGPVERERAALRFTVADTGIGVSADALPHIFESFYQADGSASRAYEGTGLGLAICREFVEAMGGTITAQSTPGSGTTVTFTVEVGVVKERRRVMLSPPLADLEGRRVLVLDDNTTNRTLLTAILKRMGMDVHTTGSGPEALKMAKEQGPFDLGLFDFNMPGHTGADVARAFAVRELQMPLVLLSSVDLNDVASGAEDRAFFDAVHTKPIDAEALKHSLRRVLAQTPAPSSPPRPFAHVDLPEKADGPPADAPPETAPDSLRPPNTLRVIVAEDDPTNRDLIRIVLGRLGVRPVFAENGQALLDRLAEQPFDVAFVDMMMPVMDGLTAAREIKTRYGARRPRLIALTARAMKGDREEILAADLDDYVTKPFTMEQLRAALEKVPGWKQPAA